MSSKLFLFREVYELAWCHDRSGEVMTVVKNQVKELAELGGVRSEEKG